MKHAGRLLAFSVLLLAVALIALGCGGGEPEEVEVTRVVTQEVPVEVTRVVEVTPAGPAAEPEPAEPAQPAVEIPFYELWVSSAHNAADTEPFTHWDEDDPQEVPPACAKCHSTPGYRDAIGADGTAAGVVDNPAPIGTTVECVACHNDVTINMDSVVMPSGVELTGLGDESRCMQCHQGRASTIDVNNAIEEAGVDMDTVSEDLGFINIHYFAAAATQYGTEAKGGYEYDGKSYDIKFQHVAGYDFCQACHNQHSLEIRLEECQACHAGVGSREDLVDIRMAGSMADYDGDGDLDEGVMAEIHGLQEMLLGAIQAYADEVVGTAAAYSADAYPYFFIDGNGNGEADEDEANFGNRYITWTPRLLKAAYNYQVSKKDPGEFAHGGKYIIQLLYDSIEDLNGAIAEPVDLSSAHRIDPGHFAGSEEAFRHWDEDGEVSGSCAKCHSAEGLPFFLEHGVNVAAEPANGLYCSTCHDSVSEFTRYTVNEVAFPSGAVLSFGEAVDSNLCLNCHQGRESTVSVNELTEGVGPDTISEQLGFLNVHYFAAGATLFGSEAQGGYQYEGQEYVGRNMHVPNFNQCVQCHTTHALEVRVEACTGCHPSVEGSEEGLQTIRMSQADYDGDGDAGEGLAGEIDTLRAALYGALQSYAGEVVGSPVVYDSHSYPYYFNDSDEDGEVDADEANFGNRYNTWSPRLLRAAYNYQYASKDPGGFAHNGKYVIQLLYDSLSDVATAVDVDMQGMVRP
jgi:hypothetical protein